jgi:hypothetical protein
MNKRLEAERQRLKTCASMSDGYSSGVSLSVGRVEAGNGLGVMDNQSSHGVVIPWMGSQHIKILVSVE